MACTDLLVPKFLFCERLQQRVNIGMARSEILLDVDVGRASVAPNIQGVQVQSQLVVLEFCCLNMFVHVA